MNSRLLALLLLSAACLEPSARAANSPSRPNVLFLMTDQQFAEAMSCRMGRQFLHTPAMDSLATNGTLFTRAYAANPLCMPSRNSMFTGRYPHETGITSNDKASLDAAEFVSMGTYLRQAGYQTAYFGKWHLGLTVKDVNAHGFEILAAKGTDTAIAENAAQFLRQSHTQPFLLVASFVNPHNVCEYARGQTLPLGPVGDPPPLAQLPPAPANLLPPKHEPDTMTTMRQAYHNTTMFPVGNFDPQKWRELRWAYYRMIEKVDAEIGKVLGALRQAGLEEKTLIVFTSDHGECAGAHGFNQKTVLYEEATRVPFIVSLKGTTPPGTCDRLVNTGIDILPTLLDFAGVAQPTKLPGLSLRSLATDRPVAQWRELVVVGNNMVQGGAVGDLRPATEGRMVRSERYKYCVFEYGRQRESLVDLLKDPGETVDLATDPAHRTVLLEHRELLRKFGREHHDPLVERLLAEEVKARPFSEAPARKPTGVSGGKAGQGKGKQ